MFRTLSYAVQFPTTGCSFQNVVTFEPGLTAIMGKNEAGKTLVLEMLRFALFGSAALRGSSSDYAKLDVKLEFSIGDDELMVHRAKQQKLILGTQTIAVGPEAINKEIERRLGFGLDVFDVACNAMQGRLDALTEMRPTERRRLVENVIGMDRFEEVEKACREEANVARKLAESIAARAVAPTAPDTPSGYTPSSQLEPRVQKLQEHKAEVELLSRLPEPSVPQAPAPCSVGRSLEELELQQQQHEQGLRERARLEGAIATIPDPFASLEEIARAEEYYKYQTELQRRGPRPDYTLEQLEQWDHVYAELDKSGRDGLIAVCPNCSHEFLPHEPHLDLTKLRDLEPPPISRKEIALQRQRHVLWESDIVEVQHTTSLSERDISRARDAHDRADEKRRLQETLGALNYPGDCSADLRAVRAHAADLVRYEAESAAYAQASAAYEAAKGRIAELSPSVEELPAALAALDEARAYEVQLARYNEAVAAYEALQEDLRQHQLRSTAFAAGGAALRAARQRIKEHLVPSLSQVASRLINLMTNGERNSVVVTEDFDVIVDGQPVRTLSGSGISVTNLALRVGLGQVLTQTVMPVFMGDELTRDMDADRREATVGVLRSLSSIFKQVLVVTHDEIDADHVVAL